MALLKKNNNQSRLSLFSFSGRKGIKIYNNVNPICNLWAGSIGVYAKSFASKRGLFIA